MTQNQPHVNGQNPQNNSTNGTTRTAEQQAKIDEFNRRLEESFFNQNDERDLMDQMIDPDGGVRVTPEDLIPRRFADGFSYGSNGNGNGKHSSNGNGNGKGKDNNAKEKKDKKPKGEPRQWIAGLKRLGYTFALNELENTIEVDGKTLDDLMLSHIYLEMYQYDVPKTYVDDCIRVVAQENSYHPIKKYLLGLQWDGENHLAKLCSYLTGDGVMVKYPDGERLLLNVVFGRWLLGCVTRALDGDSQKPFKHQTPMLVLAGTQNVGKSGFIRWLCSGAGFEYHKESPVDPHHPEHIRCAVNKWIWEVSELGATIRKSDRESLKGFLTQEWHTYRTPYSKTQITKPTLACFAGTINPETGFLDDPTGNRRYLPLTINDIDKSYAQNVDVNQLWAQIVAMYHSGESANLIPEEKAALGETLEKHEVENPLSTYVQMYFAIDPSDTNNKMFTAEIIQRLQEVEIKLPEDAKQAGKKINEVLSPMGLKNEKFRIDGVQARGWIGVRQRTPGEIEEMRQNRRKV